MLSGDPGRTLTFSMLDAIGRAVVRGSYKTAFPSECDLAKRYGVSLSVTREATKMLAAKGLLGSFHQRGTFIQPPDNWNRFDPDVLRWLTELNEPVALLRQLYELCAAMEPAAAALAARGASPAQVSAIAAELERVREADRGTIDALDADMCFRIAILRASNNPFFLQGIDIVRTAFNTAVRCTGMVARRDEDPARRAAVHAAIAAGDAKGAQGAMRTLIEHMLDWASQ